MAVLGPAAVSLRRSLSKEQEARNKPMAHKLSVALLLLLAVTRTSALEAADAAAIYRAAKDSVVQVVTENGFGSGFFFGDGSLVATNHHVIAGASNIRITTGSGIEFAITRIVRTDASLDLAILAVPVKGPPLRLVTAIPEIGANAYAIGSPRGLEGTLSVGIISGLRTDGARALLQFSAAISPGSSGGPVLDDQGRVVGVVGFLLTQSQSLNFAVSATHLPAMLAAPTAPTTASAPPSTNRQVPPTQTAEHANEPGLVLPVAVAIVDRPSASGVNITLWNRATCGISGVKGTISFVANPAKGSPLVYTQDFVFVGYWPAGEQRAEWLPIDAVQGHDESAPIGRRWYSKTVVTEYQRQCPAD